MFQFYTNYDIELYNNMDKYNVLSFASYDVSTNNFIRKDYTVNRLQRVIALNENKRVYVTLKIVIMDDIKKILVNDYLKSQETY